MQPRSALCLQPSDKLAHLEVRIDLAEVDLPDQLAAGVEDLNTVAASRVNVALSIAMDALRGFIQLGSKPEINKNLPSGEPGVT